MEQTNLKKGDTVQVISGREKGKTGKILKVLHKKDRVIVEKLNFIKKHQRPDAKGKGGVLQRESGIHLSNVMLVCSKCGKGSRIGHKLLEDGKKVRICKKCNEVLDE